MAFSKWMSLLLIAGVSLLRPQDLIAQTKLIHVAHRFPMSSQPDRGLVVLTTDERILASVPVVFISHEGNEYTAVAEANVPEATRDISALVIAQTVAGEFFSNTVKLPASLFTSELSFDQNRLKAWADERKAELKKLESEEQTLQAQMQQLEKKSGQSSVNVRAEPGGDEDLSAVTASVKLAESRLVSAQSATIPPNYKRREAELSAYLNVLSTELKLARDGGGGALSDASRDALDKRALIEATKDEHIDLLQDELARLRRQREDAERQ